MLLVLGDLKRVYSGYLQEMTLLTSRWRRSVCRIHHFHLSHNAPCLPPPPPKKRKICITILFDISWDDCNTQEKLETMVMQIWGAGVNKMHYGLCENCERMENVKNDSNIYPSFSLAFFYRLSRFCQATESHSPTHAPPSPLPNKSSSYASYICVNRDG